MGLSDRSDFAGQPYAEQNYTHGTGGVQVTAEAHGMALSLPGACPHCSSPWSAVMHSGPCPRIKAIEYHPNGAVKRIEYHDA